MKIEAQSPLISRILLEAIPNRFYAKVFFFFSWQSRSVKFVVVSEKTLTVLACSLSEWNLKGSHSGETERTFIEKNMYLYISHN